MRIDFGSVLPMAFVAMWICLPLNAQEKKSNLSIR